jgi:hypothetical protein
MAHVQRQDGRGLGRAFRAEDARRYARDTGISPEEIANAPVAEAHIEDPLADRTTFEVATLVEEPEDFERKRLLATAWLAWQLLTDRRNARRFGSLVVKHGDDVYMEQDAPWTVWDLAPYWPEIPSPEIDQVRRRGRLLSRGRHINLTRAGQPSRRFVSLDLARVKSLAEAFEREHADLVAEWRRNRRG